MRYGKALLVLCAALVVLNACVTPAVAVPTQAECTALYTCSQAGAGYQTLLASSNGCGCCSSTDPNDCVNSRKTCPGEYCTKCDAATSSASTATCTECFTGYQLANNDCAMCNVVNCDECMTDSTGILAVCRLCKNGYHWTAGTCTENTPDTGSSTNGGSTSGSRGETQCRPANCLTCSSTSATECATCQDGYNLDTTTKLCTSSCSTAHCDLCYSGSSDCQLCSEGYTWKNSQCVLAEGCRVGHCTLCEGEGSSASASTVDDSRCAECDTGYVIGNGYCLIPLECNVANCASCLYTPNQCSTCSPSYGLVNGVCTACTDPNCEFCDTDVNTCTGCAANWYLTRYGTCSPVACSLDGCLKCNSTNPTRCTDCRSPLVADSFTGKCITNGTCIVSQCQTCSSTSASQCSVCNPGYQPSADNTTCTLTTTPKPTTTTTTPEPTTTTTRAPTTTTPLPTASCSVPNCVTCISGNPNACRYCNTNYYTSNGQCVLTSSCYVGNCAQCMLRDSTKCSTCRNGYLLSSTFTCLSQHVNVNGAAAPHSLWLAAAVLVASAITYLA